LFLCRLIDFHPELQSIGGVCFSSGVGSPWKLAVSSNLCSTCILGFCSGHAPTRELCLGLGLHHDRSFSISPKRQSTRLLALRLLFASPGLIAVAPQHVPSRLGRGGAGNWSSRATLCAGLHLFGFFFVPAGLGPPGLLPVCHGLGPTWLCSVGFGFRVCGQQCVSERIWTLGIISGGGWCVAVRVVAVCL